MASRTDLLAVVPHLGDGGAQRVLASLLESWVAAGRRCHLVTLSDEDEVVRVPGSVDRTHLLRRTRARLAARVPRDRGSRDGSRRAGPQAPSRGAQLKTVGMLALRALALRRLVLQVRPRVVLSFCASANLVTLAATHRLAVRTVISERNDPTRQFVGHLYGRLRPRLYGRADVVTGNSLGAVEAMRGYVPADRLRFIPNPLLFAPQGGEQALPAGERQGFLIVARLAATKRHDLLLRALARLDGEAAWRLTAAGRGEEQGRLEALAEELGLSGLGVSSRVDWLGEVADPRPLYRAAAAFVLPSDHEGTPNALREAMAFGLPAVVTDGSPGPLALVEHERTGLVVPAGDVEALAATLARLATDADLRTRLGAAARAVASPERSALLGLWDDALGW